MNRRSRLTALLMLFVVGGVSSSGAQEAHRQQLYEKFQHDLEAIARGYEGVAGLHITDLTDGVRTAGSGVLQILTDGGSALSLEDYAIYMIVYSDNTATNVLIEELGMDAINELSASLGAQQTKLQRKMIRPEEALRGNENLSTPRDAALIMEKIAACDLPISKASCGRVREILELYKGGPIRVPVPRSVPIAFKPGGIVGVATVWALVDLPDRPYVVAVMSSYGGDGGAMIEAVSTVAYSYFSRLSGVTRYGTLVPLDVKKQLENRPR